MSLPFQRLEPRLAVAAQVQPADVAELAAAGFRSVICNRPDGEDAGQSSATQVAAAAAAAGLPFRNIPVVGSAIGDSDIAAFAQALRELPAPILAYCRSGHRSTVLWALASAGEREVDALIASGRAAGYDLEVWRARLEQRAAG